MIPFNLPTKTGKELFYIQKAFYNNKVSGDGEFTKKCSKWIEEKTGVKKVLLTTSGTAALELAAMLCDILPGDEVIMPSYTFSTTASSFVRCGAKIVFVDIRPDTMNMDENLIESAITLKTKAIVPVHYAGVGCNMDRIMEIAKKYNLMVVEDAAQAMMAKYKEKSLGTIGDIGCYSFHETKNFSMGEGGAILINNEELIERAEILREKGTDRSKFLRGEVDKYTWLECGSSFLPSEINAAYLFSQLEIADEINEKRKKIWNLYYDELKNKGLEISYCPNECTHNAHIFYIKLKNLDERYRVLEALKKYGIIAASHYIPLHSTKAGKRYGRFFGQDIYTTKESERLLRLPIFYNMTEETKTIIQKILSIIA